jgi:hypothetical protein
MEGNFMSMLNHAYEGEVVVATRASGVYLCVPCDLQFDYRPGNTDCPACSTEERDELAALYIEHDAEEAEFVHALNFSAGD